MRKIFALFLLSLSSLSLAANSSSPTLTYDIGGSTGSVDGTSFVEITLGLNYYLTPWLVWRNAPFYRLAGNDNDAAYGLDSSLLGTHNVKLAEGVSTDLMLGGGYRFIKDLLDAPFVEGGLGFHIGGLNLVGGAKYLLNSVSQKGAPNSLIYMLSISGSGSL